MTTRKQIVGNMTADVELRFSPQGKAWGTFSVASNDGKDDDKRTCFTRCKVFGEIAENVAESLSKGMRVIVQGREQTEEWEANGEKRSANVLLVDAIGPDLRWATAKVTKASRGTSQSQSAASGLQGGDPWASGPATDEPPF